MEQRPDHTPWVVAVWVEPSECGNRIGSALVRAAARAAFDLGSERAYPCAEPVHVPCYQRLGWTRIEADVDGLDILALERP